MSVKGNLKKRSERPVPIGNIIAGGFQSVGEGQSKKRSERPVPIGNIIADGL